ncbi:MAG: hypothetical protein IJC99_05525 [Clostridia bacterium]|nr:hypothetical protein [Clostridia bacterium]
MKIFKMVLCLLLLCGIICGCVAMTAAAKAEGEGEAVVLPPPEEGAGNAVDSQSPTAQGGSVTVKPTYSEGLLFRSNGDGTCALAGIGSCTASCVLVPPTSERGDRVTEILPYALAGSLVGAIELPTTVQTLSAASFADCPRLAFVRVAAGSEFFAEHDGALYTADYKVLLYCPQGRAAGTLRLHTALSRIAAGAVSVCAGLQTVIYPGTTATWHGVIVGDDNDALYAAGFRFGS